MNKIYEKIANKLKIGKSTLYQWKKTRPELHNFLINNFQNIENEEKEEIVKLYEELSKEEKEYYLTEIKARVLRKKLK